MSTACTRSRAQSLASTRPTCVFTVASESTSSAAISRFAAPCAISTSTSRSRGVSDATAACCSSHSALRTWSERRRGAMCVRSRRVVDGAITASPRCTVRIAASSSSGGASLSRKPLAPASIASNAYSSRSKVVSTTTRGASGRRSRARVASMPSISGMRTSISTTSAPATDTDATASRPLPASATTVRSGCESTSMASPERISAWSSTRATRTGTVSSELMGSSSQVGRGERVGRGRPPLTPPSTAGGRTRGTRPRRAAPSRASRRTGPPARRPPADPGRCPG